MPMPVLLFGGGPGARAFSRTPAALLRLALPRPRPLAGDDCCCCARGLAVAAANTGAGGGGGRDGGGERGRTGAGKGRALPGGIFAALRTRLRLVGGGRSRGESAVKVLVRRKGLVAGFKWLWGQYRELDAREMSLARSATRRKAVIKAIEQMRGESLSRVAEQIDAVGSKLEKYAQVASEMHDRARKEIDLLSPQQRAAVSKTVAKMGLPDVERAVMGGGATKAPPAPPKPAAKAARPAEPPASVVDKDVMQKLHGLLSDDESRAGAKGSAGSARRREKSSAPLRANARTANAAELANGWAAAPDLSENLQRVLESLPPQARAAVDELAAESGRESADMLSAGAGRGLAAAPHLTKKLRLVLESLPPHVRAALDELAAESSRRGFPDPRESGAAAGAGARHDADAERRAEKQQQTTSG